MKNKKQNKPIKKTSEDLESQSKLKNYLLARIKSYNFSTASDESLLNCIYIDTNKQMAYINITLSEEMCIPDLEKQIIADYNRVKTMNEATTSIEYKKED